MIVASFARLFVTGRQRISSLKAQQSSKLDNKNESRSVFEYFKFFLLSLTYYN